MARSRHGSTRRRFLTAGAGVGIGGLLAGCTNDGGWSCRRTGRRTPPVRRWSRERRPRRANPGRRPTPARGRTRRRWSPGTASSTRRPRRGCRTRRTTPTWRSRSDGPTDSKLSASARYDTHYYEELSGVSLDKSALTQLWQDGTGKEVCYELDVDVHTIDPDFMINRIGWDRADVDEIASNVAPFVGNTMFTRVYDWHDYRYYSLYEAFGKMAELFGKAERYGAFRAYHEGVMATVEGRLPAETPDVTILYLAEIPPESFYPYLVGEGTQSKQWTDLKVGDALAANGVTDAQAGGGTIDYETLLEIDPDAIVVRIQGGITDGYFEENVVSHVEDHAVASDLTAVENDRVIYGGLTYQGPIIHLSPLEHAAQGLYPDAFGDERLFDRGRVSDIVNGEF